MKKRLPLSPVLPHLSLFVFLRKLSPLWLRALVVSTLLPLSASALLENATVSAEVLPHASEEWLALREQETDKLKALIAAQLENMPELSGVYAGVICIREIDAHGDTAAQNIVELLRVARLQEGENALQIADESGTLTVGMVLKPEGLHWLVSGKIDYFGHGSEKGHSMWVSAVVPADLAVFLGHSKAMRALIQEHKDAPATEVQASANTEATDTTQDTLVGHFFFRTADAPAPESSAANPIHRVELPSGRVIQLEPGLSPSAARELMMAEIARDAAATNGTNQTD